MTAALLGIAAASLLGSWHCAGMCGPFALAAVCDRKESARVPWAQFAAYHLGRLATYVALTLTAFLAALPARALVSPSLRAWLPAVTGALVFLFWIGVPKVPAKGFARALSAPMRWLHDGTRAGSSVGRAAAAFGLGGVTTLLPCGWLYAFVAMAVAHSSAAESMQVIFVFWLGTIPALVGVAFFARRASSRLGQVFPPSARRHVALLLAVATAVFGGYRAQTGADAAHPSCHVQK